MKLIELLRLIDEDDVVGIYYDSSFYPSLFFDKKRSIPFKITDSEAERMNVSKVCAAGDSVVIAVEEDEQCTTES